MDRALGIRMVYLHPNTSQADTEKNSDLLSVMVLLPTICGPPWLSLDRPQGFSEKPRTKRGPDLELAWEAWPPEFYPHTGCML